MRDVIVVGAGGGGPVVAKELAARGLDVLLLEAGARNADPEHDWTHLEIDQSNTISGILRFGPADRTRSPWTREIAQNSLVWQVAGVGGTTQAYLANSPRAMPGVFAGYAGADAADYDRAHEFPFGYRDLVPYYEWVEETLPVQTAAMGTKEEIFLQAAGKLGLAVQRSKTTSQDSYRPQENAILQPKGVSGKTSDPRKLVFPQAKGCTFCGYCVQGCMEPLGAPRNLKAKRSTDNSYVPMALTADRWSPGGKAVALVADAFAYRVETDVVGGQLVARGITWRIGATGESHTEEARVIVLAAGAIETPRLWLNSGLPNPNGWVGRGLTDHYLDTVFGVMPFEIGSSKGPGSGARADFPGRGSLENAGGAPPATLASSGGFSDSGIAGFYDNGSPVTSGGADAVGRIVGRRLKSVLADVERLLSVIVVTDDDVESQNRVTLSSTFPADEHGAVPSIEVRHRNRSARTAANREFLVAKAVDLVRAAGALEVFRLNWPPYLLHIHSTMRMGASEENSVLDTDAEARSIKRLFLADNSALPNGVGGVNPTLTTQALATRTAESIFQRYFGGDAWVSQTAPVSSTDPVVTAAVIDRGL
jgi:choline dehydrogenase-like flavoprotein